MYIFIAQISHGFRGLYNLPLVLEHTLLQSHLWGKFSGFSSDIVNHESLDFIVPPGTVGWKDGAWNEKFA